MLVVTSDVGARDDDGDGGTVQASGFRAKETDKFGIGLSRIGDRESGWQVEEEA